jgi:hypothetical protein
MNASQSGHWTLIESWVALIENERPLLSVGASEVLEYRRESAKSD